jgi:hypothetical protein
MSDWQRDLSEEDILKFLVEYCPDITRIRVGQAPTCRTMRCFINAGWRTNMTHAELENYSPTCEALELAKRCNFFAPKG